MNVSLLMRIPIVVVATCFALPACGQPSDPLAPRESAGNSVAASSEAAQPAQSVSDAVFSWPDYKDRLARLSRAAGVSERSIQSVIPGLRQSTRAIELDRSQPGGSPGSAIPPYAPYQRRHVTSDIINRGRAELRQNWTSLKQIEQQTGVPAEIMLAIYGKETSYGRITGNFDLFEALGTLAWEGRRRDLFEPEFIAAMQLLDRGHPRSRLKGSWAGAAGKTQFMPTNILSLAVDGDGDGMADIWGSEPDAFASIANYMVNAGWERGVKWGIPVRVPAWLDRRAIATRLAAPRCQRVFARHSMWKSMSEWRRLGVTPVRGALADDTMATLIEPDGPNATAYLTTQNYRAILDYNCSNFYALTIGLVADRIES